MKNYLAQVDIGNEFGAKIGNGTSVGSLITNIVTTAFALAGTISLFLFLFGGWKMLTGAGQSDPKKSAEGKEAVTWAIIGLIIVISAFWIIQLIESLTGSKFITAPFTVIPGFN